jgi:hypothetical protein
MRAGEISTTTRLGRRQPALALVDTAVGGYVGGPPDLPAGRLEDQEALPPPAAVSTNAGAGCRRPGLVVVDISPAHNQGSMPKNSGQVRRSLKVSPGHQLYCYFKVYTSVFSLLGQTWPPRPLQTGQVVRMLHKSMKVNPGDDFKCYFTAILSSTPPSSLWHSLNSILINKMKIIFLCFLNLVISWPNLAPETLVNV